MPTQRFNDMESLLGPNISPHNASAPNCSPSAPQVPLPRAVAIQNFSWGCHACYNTAVRKGGSSFVGIENVQNLCRQRTGTRSPEWIRRKWAQGHVASSTHGIVRGLGLHTVCESARCPNRGECWQRRTVTFIVLGDTCTRHCSFCAVPKGIPAPLDGAEPENVAQAVRELGLAHVVITSATRDDLPDGGAAHIAATIKAVRRQSPATKIETLVSDFQGDRAAREVVLSAEPDVFGHNLEMVARLYPLLRDARHSYRRSLEVIRGAAACAEGNNGTPIVKSAMMVGLGETDDEVVAALRDLRDAGCVAVNIGQYLQPSRQQLDVARFVTPVQFEEYERLAYEMGFAHSTAGPFVRSSYHSDELWNGADSNKPASEVSVGQVTALSSQEGEEVRRYALRGDPAQHGRRR